MERLFAALRRCKLFEGIAEEKYRPVLHCLRGEVEEIPKGRVILEIGGSWPRPGVVLWGTLGVSLYSEDGRELVIDRLGQGQVFAETLVCSQVDRSPVQIAALSDGAVLYLDLAPLLQQPCCTCPYKAQVTSNLLRLMGQEALGSSQKMRILAQKRLRSRIKVYLQGLPAGPDGEIFLEMGRGELADYLCVDRSALSRELGRMQKEGILAYKGQRVTVLDKEFLTV